MTEIFSQAIKLKQAQIQESRTKWYALPKSLRETVFRCMAVKKVEKLSLNDDDKALVVTPLRYIADQTLINTVIHKKCSFLMLNRDNDSANSSNDETTPKMEFSSDLQKCLQYSQSLFERAKILQTKESKFREARECYIDALSVFCFVLPTKSDWDKKGFSDEDLLFFTQPPSNDEANNLSLKAQIGFSICSFKVDEFDDCIDQCRFLIESFTSSSSVYSLQAVYWYARATTEASTSGAVDTENAIEMLRRTLSKYQQQHSDTEEEEKSKQYKQDVLKLLAKLESEKKANDSKGKKLFSKIFSPESNLIEDYHDSHSHHGSSTSSSGPSEYQSSWKTIEDEAKRRLPESSSSTPNSVTPATTPLINLAHQLVTTAASTLFEHSKKIFRTGGFTSLRTLLSIEDGLSKLSFANNSDFCWSANSDRQYFGGGDSSHLSSIVKSIRNAIGRYGLDLDKVTKMSNDENNQNNISENNKTYLLPLLDSTSGKREEMFCELFDEEVKKFWVTGDLLEQSHQNHFTGAPEIVSELMAFYGQDDDEDEDEDVNARRMTIDDEHCVDLGKLKTMLAMKRREML